MKVIVGLGNPGLTYNSTRHNAGFAVVDLLATELGAHFKVARDLKADVAKVNYKTQTILLAKPVTYMNLSGESVQRILHWYKAGLGDLLVIHDDVSLPLGRLRLQKGGGAGGQHGVESIIECLGGRQEFDRLKVGVGPDPGGDKRADFVLSPFQPADKELFQKSADKCKEAALSWLEKGIEPTMNAFNGVILGEVVAQKSTTSKPPEKSQDKSADLQSP